MALEPLQHNRLILLAALDDVLALAQFYDTAVTTLPAAVQAHHANYFALEASRLSLRLAAVQKEIEDRDLD